MYTDFWPLSLRLVLIWMHRALRMDENLRHKHIKYLHCPGLFMINNSYIIQTWYQITPKRLTASTYTNQAIYYLQYLLDLLVYRYCCTSIRTCESLRALILVYPLISTAVTDFGASPSSSVGVVPSSLPAGSCAVSQVTTQPT